MAKLNMYASFAKETEYNGSTLPSADFAVGFNSFSANVAAGKEIVITDMTSRGKRRTKNGFSSLSADMAASLDAETVTHFAKAGLGGYKYSATDTAHYAWASEDLELQSFVARYGTGDNHLFATGLVVNTLEFSLGEDVSTFSVNFVGAKDGKGSSSAYTEAKPLISDAIPFSFSEVNVYVDGSLVEAKSATITINNSVTPESGKFLGSRFPKRLRAGEREVGVSLDVPYSSLKYKILEWGGATGPSAAGSTRFELKVELINVSGDKITFVIPKAFVDDSSAALDTKEEITQSCNIVALLDNVTLDGTAVETDIYMRIENDVTGI